MDRVILDTNVFVAAAFKRQSASARILQAVRKYQLALIWDAPTRDETRDVLTRIPPISWESVADLFLDQNRWDGGSDLWAVEFVSDVQDRKFAALAKATDTMLVSSDSDLLDHRSVFNVCTPGEFLARIDTN
jgi:predicted nucleic acid-binding protein